jgi:hypothetical protein
LNPFIYGFFSRPGVLRLEEVCSGSKHEGIKKL